MDIDPLRLAFLADANSIHTRRWVGWFAARGHAVHLLVPEDATVLPGLPAAVQLATYRPYGRGRGPLRGALAARRTIRARLDAIAPDVVHAHYVTSAGWNAWLAGRHPLVVTAWGSDVYVNTRPLNGRLQAWAVLSSADLVTADSRDLADACVRAGAAADRVRVVQFGVDGERFGPTIDGSALRERLGLTDRRILLAPRRIAPLYHQRVVVEALAALPDDVVAVFSGQGAQADELERLQIRAADLGITHRFRIVPGFEHDEMPAAYAAADVVVSVPESDGTPVTLLEALATARPVVATDLPSVREWLGDLDPGALVPVGDAAATAAAIRTRLAWTADERAAFAARATRVVRERADRDTNLGAMERAYDELRRAGSDRRPRRTAVARSRATDSTDVDRPLSLAFLGDPDSIHTRRWAAGFSGRGHRVTLLVPQGVPVAPGLEPGIAVERFTAYPALPVRGLGTLVTRRSLRRVLRAVRPDILHAHYLSRYGWMARLSGFRPYAISVWGSDVLVTPRTSRRARWWGRVTLGGAALVTAVSEALADRAVEMGARRERIRIIQFGVDAGLFAPGPADPAMAERLGLTGHRVVLSPRAVDPNFRHDVVVEAVAGLPDDVVVVLVDAGHLPVERARLEARVAAVGMTDRVRWSAAVPHDEMPGLYRSADVVVSIPRSDAFPVTALEAMACCVPLVMSDLPSAREGLAAVDPSALVDGDDPGAVRAAIAARLDLDPAARASLGATLRAAAIERGDVATNLARMEREYRGLVRP